MHVGSCVCMNWIIIVGDDCTVDYYMRDCSDARDWSYIAGTKC